MRFITNLRGILHDSWLRRDEFRVLLVDTGFVPSLLFEHLRLAIKLAKVGGEAVEEFSSVSYVM